MRLVIRAGRATVSLLDATATLCLGLMLVIYGLAWTASWPFAELARRSIALSRNITHGAAGSPASPHDASAAGSPASPHDAGAGGSPASPHGTGGAP